MHHYQMGQVVQSVYECNEFGARQNINADCSTFKLDSFNLDDLKISLKKRHYLWDDINEKLDGFL